MKIKESKKIIEQTICTFVAEDGKEFDSQYECMKYEKEQEKKAAIEAAEKLSMSELDDKLPLSYDVNENNSFRWYKVENKEAFDTVNKAYANSLQAPSHYPEIMCVETTGYEPYEDDAYSCTLTGLKATTEEFWQMMGFKVTLEPLK